MEHLTDIGDHRATDASGADRDRFLREPVRCAPDDGGAVGPGGHVVGSGEHRWPLERVLFALAGTVTLISMSLTILVSKWFALLAGFVGVNQWLYVLTGSCPASLVLRRVCGLRSAIYDNSDYAEARVKEGTV